MKKLLPRLFGICLLLLALSGAGEKVSAHETNLTELEQLMNAVRETEAREAPDTESPVVVTFSQGDSVYVTGSTGNGWYRIFYQGEEAYVQKSDLEERPVDPGLIREMETMQENNKAFVEEVERQRAALRRSRAWGAVIAVLIAAVFAAGIISVFKTPAKKKPKPSNRLSDSTLIDLDKDPN